MGEPDGELTAPVRVADFVVDRIAASIGAVAPEQGGALLGIPGTDYVTGFIHDVEGSATSVVYHNSARLIREIGEAEQHSAARFKGIVHSHPAGMPRPSGQDQREYAESLRLNAQLARYLAPIVTHDVRTALGGHELVLGPARISFFGARTHGADVVVEPVRPVVVPISRMLTRAGIRTGGDPAAVAVEGAVLLATRAEIPGVADDATVLFGTDFPATAPILLLGGDTEPVTLGWDLGRPAVERLAAAVGTLRRQRSGGRAREGEGRRADEGAAGGASHPAEAEPHPADAAQQTDAAHRYAANPAPALLARSTGLLSPALGDRRVLIVGAGSVGSYLAEVLARSGVGAFTLIDPDTVDPANLGRSGYRFTDIGLPKVRALADLVHAVNPRAAIDAHHIALEDLDPGDLAAAVARADLVIAATDSNAAQERVGHFAYFLGRPAVFPGLYRGAAGGEVIVVVDGAPCWGCSTGGVRGATAEGGADPHRGTDYGTGRLVAEPGLLVDIHHVSSAAAKLALGLLHDADDEAATARFAAGALAGRQTYAAFANQPDFWIFKDVLRDAPAQYAFQSLWLSTVSRVDCPVCGKPEGRTDPREYQGPEADADTILAYFRAAAEAGPGAGSGPEAAG